MVGSGSVIGTRVRGRSGDKEYSQGLKMVTKQKMTVYFPKSMVDELMALAEVHDRPVSWLLQQAWKMARARLIAADPFNREEKK